MTRKTEIKVFIIQLAAWLATTVLSIGSTIRAIEGEGRVWTLGDLHILSFCRTIIYYFVCYYLFVPRYLYKHRASRFYLYTLAAFALLWSNDIYDKLHILLTQHEMDEGLLLPFKYLFLTALPLLVRNQIYAGDTRQQLAEAQRKITEAEMAQLKSQINPHFLFNTLNNISSLTQISPDLAQEAIGQLSDCLRYTIYDARQKMVRLKSEADFLNNYISLMRLRYGPNVTVKADIHPEHDVDIAPLLFICFVENAFKHGIDSSKPSMVSVSLTTDEGHVFFCCDNTYYPKTASDHSGNGIGLSNTLRRLQLIYPQRHTYEQTIVGGIWQVRLALQVSQPSQ